MVPCQKKEKGPFLARVLVEKAIPKSTLARSLGTSQFSIYYIPQRPAKDIPPHDRISDTLVENMEHIARVPTAMNS